MKLSRETSSNSNLNIIRGYSDGEIIINEKVVSTSCILTPTDINENWAPQTLTDIQLNHFEPLLELEPEIIILGTGKALQFPEREIMMHIMRQGVGFEVMDTAAACRTYNILIGEDRRVAAGLLMIR